MSLMCERGKCGVKKASKLVTAITVSFKITRRYRALLLVLLFCTFFLTLTPFTVFAQGGVWVDTGAGTPTTGGFGEAVVGTGDYIYVIRAWSTGRCYFWRYDPSANSWTTVLEWNPDTPIPRPKTGTALAWDGGDYIYALLGAAYTDSNRLYFYRYSISTNSWVRLADTPHAQGAGDAITWSGYDNLIYALLGSNVHGACFARYNPTTNTWETLPFNPSWTLVDDGASLVWTGGEYLYALNGEWEETTPHNDFARYHIPTGTWENLPSIPVSNGVGDGASLLWIGNRISEYSDYIFALGGNDVDENPGYGFYRYSISQNSWMQMTSIPYPVGYYVGNRLGFAAGHIYYWQGAPSTWSGGGNKFCRFNAPILSVVMTDSPDPVEAGFELTYTITYSNTGDIGAKEVVITETYDPNVEFVSANPAPDPGTDNRWTLGDLSAGASGALTITVRVSSSVDSGTVLTNRVKIESEGGVFSYTAAEDTAVYRAPIPPTPPPPRPSYPVGGVLTSVNKLAILAPYLTLIGLAAVLAIAVKRRRR